MKLEQIAILARLCTELESHLGIQDVKTLAEFIYNLYRQSDNDIKQFRQQLDENGAEFGD